MIGAVTAVLVTAFVVGVGVADAIPLPIISNPTMATRKAAILCFMMSDLP
ncbi:hypothetical protein [Amycolatopsis magusensis]